VLKVDRAFIGGVGRGGRDAALARTILALGESLGLGMVAEGVETAEQEARLRTLGCEHAQGYYFSRPVTPEVLGGLLGQRLTPLQPMQAVTAVPPALESPT
jgi:EAL domain-containing protein (putative c-di-GMP-specific phosphodiesterase class I)